MANRPPPKPVKPSTLRANPLHKSSENNNHQQTQGNPNNFLQPTNFALRNAVSNPEIRTKVSLYGGAKYPEKGPWIRPKPFINEQPHPRTLCKTYQQETKQNRIARELIETEISYLQDLKVLKELFYDNPQFESEQKLLFTGLIEVKSVAESLVSRLNEQNVAKVFLDSMATISDAYCLYCKSNEQALQKIKDYNQESHPLYQVLISTQLEMKGRTNAWDLSSMIVKPVQRVLKYPLLLKRLSEEEEDPDLLKAVDEMNSVADLINQVKKRKDVVEKYATKSNKNIVHGFNKKLIRQTQKIINAIEGENVDDGFESLCRQFDSLKDLLNSLDKSINSWVQSIKTHLTTEHNLSIALENLYILDRTGIYTDSQKLVTEYRISKQVCLDSTFKILENRTKSTTKIIHRGLEMFLPVTKIIKKRNDKHLDYERLQSIKAKGEVPDSVLVESGDEYLSMNTLIIEEIPKFIGFIGQLVHAVMDDLVSIQKEFCKGYEQACHQVERAFVVEGFSGFERIPNDYYAAMAPGRDAEVSCRGIELISKWKDSVWGSGKFTTNVDVPVTRMPSFSSLPRSRDVSLIDFSAVTLSPTGKNLGHSRAGSVDSPRSSTLGRTSVKTPTFIPTLIPKQLHFKVRCLFKFQAETPDELDMEVGDVLDVDATVERGTDGWWFGTSVRGVGWIPSNFVEKL